jgi:tetratricopeptide (TPR) repeat protein
VRDGAAIDPKDHIAVWEEIQRAVDRYSAGAYREAADRFAALLERQGTTPLLYEYLGASLIELERWEEAADVYLRALAAGVDGARLRIDLARCEELRGDLAAAEQNLRIALEHDPTSVTALYHLADLARRRGPLPRALELYRRALDINPDYLYAWNGLAMAHVSAGDDEAALAAFERAAALAPGLAEPHFNLAVQLERMGRPAAAAAYRRFLEISGGESGWERQRQLAKEALQRLEGPASGTSRRGPLAPSRHDLRMDEESTRTLQGGSMGSAARGLDSCRGPGSLA